MLYWVFCCSQFILSRGNKNRENRNRCCPHSVRKKKRNTNGHYGQQLHFTLFPLSSASHKWTLCHVLLWSFTHLALVPTNFALFSILPIYLPVYFHNQEETHTNTGWTRSIHTCMVYQVRFKLRNPVPRVFKLVMYHLPKHQWSNIAFGFHDQQSAIIACTNKNIFLYFA